MVDDGSTDGSAAIAEALRRSRPPLPAPAQPNAGLSAARNTGIDAATGEFLAFVDSDDMLKPQAYELLLGLARQDRLGLRQRQRAAASPAPARSRRASSPRRSRETQLQHAHHEEPPPARRPHGVEQAVAALVLGRARPALPGGPDLRGHPGHAAAALRRATRSTSSPSRSTSTASARAPTARSPSGGPRRAPCATGSPPSRRSSPSCAATGPGAPSAGTTGRRPAGPALLPQRPRRGRRGVPDAVHRPRQRVPRRRAAQRLRAGWRRSSGSSGISCGAGCCPSCWRSAASSARSSATRRRC